jgi:hypothetical protein
MSLAGHDLSRSISENYLAFSREARGRSRPYEILAAQVAGNRPVLAFLAALPPVGRQPNLLFAAARYLLGRPADEAPFQIVRDGHLLLAAADGHGTWLHWPA